MNRENSPKNEVKWDQHTFEEFKAGLSQSRLAKDKRLLKEIFNLASRSPTAMQALDWAEQHGVQFSIDRTMTDSFGCYKNGIVFIAEASSADAEDVVDTITHEIRHAWQDYHGLIRRRTDSFSQSFIQAALTEADANAFGERAAAELRVARLKRLRKVNPKRRKLKNLQRSLTNEKADLGKKFLSWFSSDLPEVYGEIFSKSIGRKAGVIPAIKPPAKGRPPKAGWELKERLRPLGTGVDTNHIEDVLKLGQSFSGTENYLAQLPKEVLLKQILAPSLADTFYGAANDDQKKLTADIRKAHLQKKLKPGNAP
nr:hypothetical protein [uncultured bacterium]